MEKTPSINGAATYAHMSAHAHTAHLHVHTGIATPTQTQTKKKRNQGFNLFCAVAVATDWTQQMLLFALTEEDSLCRVWVRMPRMLSISDGGGPSPKEINYTTPSKAQGTLQKQSWEGCNSSKTGRAVKHHHLDTTQPMQSGIRSHWSYRY